MIKRIEQQSGHTTGRGTVNGWEPKAEQREGGAGDQFGGASARTVEREG